MSRILVDADGCPVKQEIIRVARRCHLSAVFVANTWMRLPQVEGIEMVVTGEQLDAADDWIAEQTTDADIVITTDIPLAARALKKGAIVLDPRGGRFTEERIGQALASRELMSRLRQMGEIGGGPRPLEQRHRSLFLQSLDAAVQAARRRKGGSGGG